MNANQFARYLKKRGIEISSKNSTGHCDLHNPANDRWSQMPMHGGRKQMGTGLMRKILKDLGLA